MVGIGKQCGEQMWLVTVLRACNVGYGDLGFLLSGGEFWVLARYRGCGFFCWLFF
jgi:hypothetical protein